MRTRWAGSGAWLGEQSLLGLAQDSSAGQSFELEADVADVVGCDLQAHGFAEGQVAQAGGARIRTRSSARARWRCRSSGAAIGTSVVLVAKQVSRRPSASVNRSWAPGCGRSLRTISRIPLGPALQDIATRPLLRRASRTHWARRPRSGGCRIRTRPCPLRPTSAASCAIWCKGARWTARGQPQRPRHAVRRARGAWAGTCRSRAAEARSGCAGPGPGAGGELADAGRAEVSRGAEAGIRVATG